MAISSDVIYLLFCSLLCYLRHMLYEMVLRAHLRCVGVCVALQAEDPDEGFKPTTGVIHELSMRSVPAVWGYFSIKVP